MLPIALVVSLVALFFLGAGCHTKNAPFVISTWEEVAIFNLEADSQNAGPFLSLGQQVTGPIAYMADVTPTTGASRIANELANGDRPGFAEFKMKEPLATTFYLNVTKPIVGTIYVSNVIGQTEDARIRVELLAGDRRVGIYEADTIPAAGAKKWTPFYFGFRPEASKLDVGSVLSLRVTQIASLADFYLGIEPPTQSFLEIHYYLDDPLGGTLYLQDGRLVASINNTAAGSPASLQEFEAFAGSGSFQELPPGFYLLPSRPHDRPDETVAALASGFLPFALRLLFGPLGKGRRRGISAMSSAVALLLLAGAFSGCLGQGANGGPARPLTSSESGQAGVEISYEPSRPQDSNPDANGRLGAIRGIVRGEQGESIWRALVTIPGTKHRNATGQEGQFTLDGVNPGNVTLVVQAAGHYPAQVFVDVKAGQTAVVTIALVYDASTSQNARPHIHDEWGEATRIQIQDVGFTPTKTCVYTSALDVTVLSNWGGFPQESTCKIEIPIDPMQNHILPGTIEIEVLVEWTKGPRSVRELQLFYTNPSSPLIANNVYGPRKSGEAFHIAVFPNEADPGHQKFTNWQFFLAVPSSALEGPWAPPLTLTGELRVKMFIQKGVVPFEPAHKNFWGRKVQLPAVDADLLAPHSEINIDYPMANAFLAPNAGRLVPPGTAEIKGTFRWAQGDPVCYGDKCVNPNQPGNQIKYFLLFKPANIPAASWQDHLQAVTETERLADQITFVIKAKSNETDQFYQTASNWRFYVGDDKSPTVSQIGTSYRGDVVFTLNATAFKDPSYRDT